MHVIGLGVWSGGIRSLSADGLRGSIRRALVADKTTRAVFRRPPHSSLCVPLIGRDGSLVPGERHMVADERFAACKTGSS